MSRVLLAPVSGRATHTTWSQALVLGGVHGQWVDLNESPRGILLACVTLNGGDEEIEAADLGKELADRLETAWHENQGLISGEDLLGLGRALGNELEGLKTFKLLLVHFSKDVVRVVGNSGQVLLKRGEHLAKLFEGDGDYVLMEGRYEHGDRWLIGTDGLMGEMDAKFAASLLQLDTVSLAGEELSTQVQAMGESEAVAGLVIHTEPLANVQPEEVEKEQVVAEKPQPEVYLRQEKRRKAAVLVGLAILVILTISLGLGWRQRQERMWQDRFNAVKSETEQLAQQAQALGGNSVEARRLMQQAVERAKAATNEYKDKQEYQAMLSEYIKNLEAAYQQLSGEKQAEAQEWFDLGLIRTDFFGQQMALTEERIVVLDGERGLLASVTLPNKQSSLVGGGALLAQAKDVAASGKRAVSISPSGVVELSTANKTTGILVQPDSEWQQITQVGMFGGNVYLVDSGAGAVWHYPGLESGVGSRRLWFGPGVNPDLSKVVSMAIDGDVWLLRSNGDVLRYRRGAPMTFWIDGLDVPINEAVAIFVSGDNEEGKVYVLDRGNKRVVVATKEGKYEKQYLWEGLAAVSDMGVAEEQGLILLLSGSTIYSIKM